MSNTAPPLSPLERLTLLVGKRSNADEFETLRRICDDSNVLWHIREMVNAARPYPLSNAPAPAPAATGADTPTYRADVCDLPDRERLADALQLIRRALNLLPAQGLPFEDNLQTAREFLIRALTLIGPEGNRNP